MPSTRWLSVVWIAVCYTTTTIAQQQQQRPLFDGDADDVCGNFRDDLFHCQNPYTSHLLIPCDPSSCLWQLDALNASGPPGFCRQVAVTVDAGGPLYDEVKPCVLWQRMFGTLAPTLTPIEDEDDDDDSNDDEDDDTVGDDDANVAEGEYVSIERFLVYLFFTAPTSLVATTLADPDILHIVRFHMNEQIESVVSDRLGYGTTAHTVLGLVDTPVAPFRNGTVVATLSVAVGLQTPVSSAASLPHALESLVTAAITDPTWREERLSVYAVLNRIYSVSTTTPDDWSVLLDDYHATRQSSSNSKWFHSLRFWTADFWAPIAWGNWKDLEFALFVSILCACSVVTLFCCGMVAVCRRQRMRQAETAKCTQVLAAASTLEEAAILQEEDDDYDYAEEEVLEENRSLPLSSSDFRGALSNSTCSYIEEEVLDDDIQSFAVNPGSTYDFGVSGIVNSGSYYEEETIISEVEEETVQDDDDEVVSKTSTISQHPVNLENESQKGTVVVFNDSESVSTASDSIISAVFDFAKAAWQQKPKPKVPSSIRRRQEGGGVRAAIATFEKVAHTSPLSADKTVPLPKLDSSNVLGIVTRIETENRCGPSDEDSVVVVDLEAANGDVVIADDAVTDVVERISPVVTPRSSTPVPRRLGVLNSLSRLLFSPSKRQQQNMSVVLSDIEDGLTAPSHARSGGESLVSVPTEGEKMEGLEPPEIMREGAVLSRGSMVQQSQPAVCHDTATTAAANPPNKIASAFKLFQKKETVAVSEKASLGSVKSIPSQASARGSVSGSHKQDALVQVPSVPPSLPATDSWKGPGRWRSQTPPATRSQCAASASPISQSSHCSSAPSSPQTSVAKAGTVLSRISAFEKKVPLVPPVAPFPPPRRFIPRPIPSGSTVDASVVSPTVKPTDPVSFDKAKKSPAPHAGKEKEFKSTTGGLASPSISTATTVQSLSESCFSDGAASGKAPSVQTTVSENEVVETVSSAPKVKRSVLAVAKQYESAAAQGSQMTTVDGNAAPRSHKTKAMEGSDFIDLSKSKTSSLARTKASSPRKSKRSVSDAVKTFEKKTNRQCTVDCPVDLSVEIASEKLEKESSVLTSTSVPSQTNPSSLPNTVTPNMSMRDPSPVTLSHCDGSNGGESSDVPAWLKAFNQIQSHSSATESFETQETTPSGQEVGYCENGAIMVADDEFPAVQLQETEGTKQGRPRGRSRRPNHQKMPPVNLTNRIDDHLGDIVGENEQNTSCLSVDVEIADTDAPVAKFPMIRRAQSATPLDRQASCFLPWGRPSSRGENVTMSSDTAPGDELTQPKGAYILRTNLSKAFNKGRRSQSAAPRDRQKAEILRSWGDTIAKTQTRATSSFAAKSARSSKATKKVLNTNHKSPGTPATLPSTPLSHMEYQDSETSDIKSICSKDPVFALYENAQRTPNASPAKRMSNLRPNDQQQNLLTVSEVEVEQTRSQV